MAERKKKMYLVDFRKYEAEQLKDVDFSVEKATNSTYVKVGVPISEEEVNDLLAEGWEIEIRAPQNKDFK